MSRYGNIFLENLVQLKNKNVEVNFSLLEGISFFKKTLKYTNVEWACHKGSYKVTCTTLRILNYMFFVMTL